jgi:hypothetical protein
VRHHIGEQYARKDQDTCESRSDGVHSHAMPPIIVVAFRAFIFCVWDGRVIWTSIIDVRVAGVTSARGADARPELYDTTMIGIRLGAIGYHDEYLPIVCITFA